MGTWMNEDNLYLKYGVDKTNPTSGGEYKTFGELRTMEFKIDLTTLGTSPAILSDTSVFPRGALIEQVEVFVEEAATSGGSAVLNVGLIKTDRSTAIDADGIVKALALTAINADGEKNTLILGSTGAGDLIGVITTDVGYVTADYDTAAFTAGIILVRIKYYLPTL